MTARVRPNPIDDAAVFEVLGAEPTRIEVVVWSLARRVIYDSGWMDASEVVRDRRTKSGERVAAGVYVYRNPIMLGGDAVIISELETAFVNL